MFADMKRYIDSLGVEELANRATEDVYRRYHAVMSAYKKPTMPKSSFSREVRRVFGLCAKRRRVGGKLVAFCVREDD